MNRLIAVAYLVLSLLLSSLFVSVMAATGEPNSVWLLCEVGGLEICPHGD